MHNGSSKIIMFYNPFLVYMKPLILWNLEKKLSVILLKQSETFNICVCVGINNLFIIIKFLFYFVH